MFESNRCQPVGNAERKGHDAHGFDNEASIVKRALHREGRP